MITFSRVCIGIGIVWLTGGILTFFLFDREVGLQLIFSLVVSAGLVGLARAVIRVLQPISAFLGLELGADADLGKLVFSSKTETASPVDASQGFDGPIPEGKKKGSRTAAKSLLGRMMVFLSEPAAKGQLSNSQALFMVSLFLGGIVWLYAYIWSIVGTKIFLTFIGILLVIGLLIFLLSLFETGRKILRGILTFLQILMMILEIFSIILGGVSRASSGRGGGGSFGGGGASGKW